MNIRLLYQIVIPILVPISFFVAVWVWLEWRTDFSPIESGTLTNLWAEMLGVSLELAIVVLILGIFAQRQKAKENLDGRQLMEGVIQHDLEHLTETLGSYVACVQNFVEKGEEVVVRHYKDPTRRDAERRKKWQPESLLIL